MDTKVFKVGDRVSVESYSGACWFPNEERLDSVKINKHVGTIVSAKNGGFLVRPDTQMRHGEYLVSSPRMLRRLKLKKRREWQITKVKCSDGTYRDLASGPRLRDDEIVLVREVRNDSQSSQPGKK